MKFVKTLDVIGKQRDVMENALIGDEHGMKQWYECVLPVFRLVNIIRLPKNPFDNCLNMV